MTIDVFPTSYLKNNFFLIKANSFPLFKKNSCYFYSSGRSALYHGVKALSPKRKIVLVPSFHCGVETEAFKLAGFKIIFYNTKRDLTIDFSDIENKLSEKVLAILVIHYFGFPQPINYLKDICRELDIILIEDCAHALFSSNEEGWLGTFGEISIYSLSKTLPVPNGGILLVNCENILPDTKYPNFSLACIKRLFKMIFNLTYFEPSKYLNNLKKNIMQKFFIKTYECNNMLKNNLFYYDKLFSFDNGICIFSKVLINRINFHEIIKKRQQNYLKLLREINWNHKIRPLYAQNLSQFICPLCFPILVPDNNKFADILMKQKIKPFIFGKTPHRLLDKKLFPDAKMLRNRIIGLPIHQYLSTSALEKIISRLNLIVKDV